VPFEAALIGATERPLYQRISAEVKHLHELGLSLTRITQHLGVTDKTATKALSWAK